MSVLTYVPFLLQEIAKLDDEYGAKCDQLMKERKYSKTNGTVSKNGSREPATEKRQLETLPEEGSPSHAVNGSTSKQNGNHIEVEVNGNGSDK